MSDLRPTEEAYAELQFAYDYYNENLFDGGLPPCMITFQRQKRTFGYFSKNRFGRRDGRKTDEIALNPEYFAVVPMVEVLQTLVHEMAHLWQEHFGKPSRACYHNREWADKMEAVGLMPSETGRPGGKRVGQSMMDYVIAGGHFDKATRRLLADGFAISWLDRFPAAPPSPSFTLEALGIAADGETNAAGSTQALASAILESLSPGQEAELAAAWLPPTAMQPELAGAIKVGNRSNRSKYTCPKCSQVNVWGKPGLKIICEACEVRLIEGGNEE